ncbi:MAG: hypothetical protein ACI94Y_002123, partial [Maribacter sp.]
HLFALCCVGKNLITLRRNATFTALPSTKISYQFQTLIYSSSLNNWFAHLFKIKKLSFFVLLFYVLIKIKYQK